MENSDSMIKRKARYNFQRNSWYAGFTPRQNGLPTVVSLKEILKYCKLLGLARRFMQKFFMFLLQASSLKKKMVKKNLQDVQKWV